MLNDAYCVQFNKNNVIFIRPKNIYIKYQVANAQKQIKSL